MQIHIDFFKTTGKWYTAVVFEEPGPLPDSLDEFLRQKLTETVEGKTRVRFAGMTAVCQQWRGVPHLTVVPEPLKAECNRHKDCEKADAAMKLLMESDPAVFRPTEHFHCHDSACKVCLPTKVRSCNRHKDCDAADAKVKAKYDAATLHEKAHLPMRADHCDDETCEDCFGS